LVKQTRIPGVLGGKGPEATVELLHLILEHTPAQCEEEHLRIIVDSNPHIPKYALAIVGEGEDPVPALIETAQNLERAHADFIVIPCNSAHYYIEAIRKAVAIPVVSLIDETAKQVGRSACKCIGILASTGLIQSGVYQRRFKKEGIEVLAPGEAIQNELTTSILRFKDTGNIEPLRRVLHDSCESLIKAGAEGIVLGCTELPLALEGRKLSVPCFDTLEILAKAVVREATI
jgi:aspartate racemase